MFKPFRELLIMGISARSSGIESSLMNLLGIAIIKEVLPSSLSALVVAGCEP
jgi:hypothetical protein